MDLVAISRFGKHQVLGSWAVLAPGLWGRCVIVVSPLLK